MKIIKLTQNKETIVDDKYYEYLNKYKWCAEKHHSDTYYAARNNGKHSLRMHRIIMKQEGHDIENKQIDHINNDSLDNRIKNLRVCNNTENNWNRKIDKRNSSGYKGVHWHKHNKKWMARIRIGNNKRLYLGEFDKKEEAAIAYDIAAIKYHGEFANTNFPKDNYVSKNT